MPRTRTAQIRIAAFLVLMLPCRSQSEETRAQTIPRTSPQKAEMQTGKYQDLRAEADLVPIVSDGGDNHSRYTTRDIWSVLLEAEVQVYSMGIFDEAPRTKAERMGPDLLSGMTSVTGGRTFPIHNLKGTGNAVDELALDLRNQYLIAYRPQNLAHDGKWHKISVRVKLRQSASRLHVYAKHGYYAPGK